MHKKYPKASTSHILKIKEQLELIIQIRSLMVLFQIFITCCVSLWLHCFLLNIFLILVTKRKKKKNWIFQENVSLNRMCFRTLKTQKTAQGHLVPSPPMGNALKECVIPWGQEGKRRAKRHILNLTLFLFFLWSSH